MRLVSLGSGSKGNATLVESNNACLLVDCGLSVRELKRRMGEVNRQPEDLSGILLTHEHSDHRRGVLAVARKYSVSVYMTAGTAAAMKGELSETEAIEIVCGDNTLPIEDIGVTPVAVPHDAREPVQYLFASRGVTLGVLTDLGSITPHVLASYGRCDGLLLEANHDSAMLAEGPYPASLKRRIAGDWGHLSNGQTAALLEALDCSRLQGIVIGHISETNNAQARVEAQLDPYVAGIPAVHYASQEQVTDWLTLE